MTQWHMIKNSLDTDNQSEKTAKLRKRYKRRTIPWALRWLRLSFAVLNVISPRMGARKAYRLWFTSPRFHEPAREQRWRQSAREFTVAHEVGPLAAYQWGEGPTVLLVHGWSGRGAQMGAFAAPLVKRGFSVVAFDAPGHGRSPGAQTNVFQVADALATVAKTVGPVKAVISHSFGTMATTLAVKQGLQVEKAICISAPTSALYLIERFCHSLTMNERTLFLLKQMLERDFGEDIWQRIASDQHVIASTVAALIIHDKDDLDVPWQWSEQLAKAWPNSYFWLTQGLGHRRILRNPTVIKAVCDYIAADQLPAEATNYQPQTTPSSKSSMPR
jgi:pimeloyl-ACP methyl ester carboxylesterase